MNAKKILWIDDDMDKMAEYPKALRESGFELTELQHPADFLKCCQADQFNLLLVDLRMDEMDGISLLEQAAPLQPNAAIVVVSSFLYYQDYKARLDAIGVPYEAIEKPFPNVHDSDFEKTVLRPLQEWAAAGRTHAGARQSADVSALEPFRISFTDFMALPIKTRNALHDRAMKIAAKTIKEQFDEGNEWILLCGSATAPRKAVKYRYERPKEAEILEFARKVRKAPYTFSRGPVPEEIWTQCPRNQDLHNYPTVTLRFPKGDVTAHFDTGSPVTFFSYEEIVHLGGRDTARAPTMAIRYPGGPKMLYRYVEFQADCEFVCQYEGETKKIVLNGEAVWDWEESCFVKLCQQERESNCTHCRIVFDKSLPVHRIALVGRTLLVDNELKIVLDGKNMKTALAENIPRNIP